MKIIEKLSSLIEDEIDGAKCYAKMAVEYKDSKPEFARMLFGMSGDEMEHMGKLHGAVVDMINEYSETNGEPPANMMTLYDYLHKKHIESAAEVKALQALYKEQ